MKRVTFLIFMLMPVFLFASTQTDETTDFGRFSKAVRIAYKKLDNYINERLYDLNRRATPVIPQAIKPDEDFSIVNMNLTILPTVGNTADDSKVLINSQIIIRVTGSSPLSGAVFYSKSYQKITVESPDAEITYNVEPYSYDNHISIIYISFTNPIPRDSIIRLSITTEGKPICDPSEFLGLVTCQYNTELTYDLSILHPMRADQKTEAFSFDISIVIPDDYFSTASGEFIGSVENGDGTKTELWHNDLAQFVAFGMAKFDRYSSDYEGENNKIYKINSYVLPPRGDAARGFHPLIGKALEWYSKKFYPYQYPAISFNEIDKSSDAAYATPMAQFMPSNLIERGAQDNEAIETFAHEVAHQWWAFMIMKTVDEFPWIDEGFAEFSAMEFITRDNPLARIFMYGVYTFLYFYIVDPSEDVPICSPEVFNNDYNYVLLTYYKGALVLSQLLNIMGEDMYKVISHYASKNLFQAVDVDKLKEAFKDVTGDDYSWYFDKWLYQAGYPIYTLKYDIKNESGKRRVDLFISQASSTYKSTQKNVLFDMPLDIAFYDESRNEIKRVTENIKDETFEKGYEFDEDVNSLVVDPAVKVYIKRVRSAQEGDVTLDMEVDGRDVLLAAYSYGFSWYSYFERENARFLPNTDLNMDGIVNDDDLTVVVNNFGKCLLTSCK
ncbi:MAG: M1 family aminopeptidase [Myxococcota bacterium]